MQILDLQLAFQIDLVVMLCLKTVLCRLSVLAHHDDGRRIGCLKAQREVQQDEWIWIPLFNPAGHIEGYPHHQNGRLNNDEAPAPHDRGKAISDALTSGDLLCMTGGDILSDATTSQSQQHVGFRRVEAFQSISYPRGLSLH